MPKWLKIVLILLGTGVLGVGLLVGGFAWWISANRDRITREGGAAQKAGRAFGATHSQSECIDDSLGELKGCGQVDFMCEAMAKLRLTSCISVARDDGTCKAAPGSSEIMKSAVWGSAECNHRGQAGSQACGRLLGGIGQACEKARGGR